MIGTWPLGLVDQDLLADVLEELRVTGFDRAVMMVEELTTDPNPRHNPGSMYWLVCTDPDGEWYWINDHHDTGWTMIDQVSVMEVPIAGKNITLIVAA